MNNDRRHARKPPVRQPAANPPRPRSVIPKDEGPREKTPAEIIEEKMAIMAAHPDAVPVYWTEHGPDAKGWDVIFPEYKILSEAFKGGYGWWDLTEGRGQHLLPKPRPYKIVHISKAELKVIRDREAVEEAAAAAAAKAAKEAEFAAYRAAAARKKELELMAAEDLLAAAVREAERETARKAAEKALFYSALSTVLIEEILAIPDDSITADCAADLFLQRMANYDAEDHVPILERVAPAVDSKIRAAEKHRSVDATIKAIMAEIRGLPAHLLYEDYLADLVAERIQGFAPTDQERMIVSIVSAVEKENMLFYTPVGSPEVEPAAAAQPPPPLSLTAPYPCPPLMPPQLIAPPEDTASFLAQPPFPLCGTTYIPAYLLSTNQRMYVPISFLEYALRPPPPPPPPPKDTPCTDPNCRLCAPPLLPTPTYCGDNCPTCNPPPQLPVVKARLVTPPLPTYPTPEMMKNIKIRKMRMPRMSRIQRILAGGK
jgi:hypothetical protein